MRRPKVYVALEMSANQESGSSSTVGQLARVRDGERVEVDGDANQGADRSNGCDYSMARMLNDGESDAYTVEYH
ncbi:hypothetical protein E2562_007881 [Oryza meyeriana var. granulata]|uniref:Uncharacterized protein n=1 Tax=Oryza meyeriana var. granulata TaxID=110450 RepID=A0A6G1F5H5_9ORYZ|nr:hypothetical protein E2562_007881 [Oryza meyeriana var. granulata]